MIIKKIEIVGFGKFTDTVFELDKGINLVYGNNEDGKTTLMAFIKMMLYSSSARTEKSSDLFKALRKKYRPWNGAPMVGAIEFESGDMLYRIQKEFLKSEASDKTTVFCISTGEGLQIENQNEAGEYFLGMTAEEFERSVFMGQSGGFTAEGAGDCLAMRVSNLSVSGDENVSHEQILKRLVDAKEELVSKSRKKGLLVEAEARLDALETEKQQLELLEDTQKDTESEIMQLSAEVDLLEAELNALTDLERTENAKKDWNAFFTLQNKLNLLKTEKGRLDAYDKPYEALDSYVCQAKELNAAIDEKLLFIQEATVRKDTDIPDSEFARLCELDARCQDIRRDLSLTRDRLAVLWTKYQDAAAAALKGARLVAVLSAAAVLALAAAALAFAPAYGLVFAAILTALGLGLFFGLYFTAKKRSEAKTSVQFCKHDYAAAARDIVSLRDEPEAKSPQELETLLCSLLSDATDELSLGLNAFGAADIEQLKEKSGRQSAEKIKQATDELAVLKSDFVTLSSGVSPCPTYSAARILFAELCDSLEKEKSIQKEIESICTATGIENTNEDFVADKIKALGELIQNASIMPADSTRSIPETRKALSEKRALLGSLQSRIKHPERSMSELLKEIDLTKERKDGLAARLEEIETAIDVMNEAIQETNKGLGSQLSQKVSEYIAKITNGRYTDVLVPRDLSLEARGSGGQGFHEWKYLSSGAIDKVYLALRLAMTDILASNHCPLPLFLDDIFAQYDDESCVLALNFLKEYAKCTDSVSQIAFFTCHKNTFELAKNVFDNKNEIIL